MENRFYKSVLVLLFMLGYQSIQAQANIKIDKIKEQDILPLVEVSYFENDRAKLAEWKKSHEREYLELMWYLTESYRIERNYFQEGVTLDQTFIDVRRHEHLRKKDEEHVVVLPNFRDVIVLIPESKLLYKPKQ
jgi:hypothetical protein